MTETEHNSAESAPALDWLLEDLVARTAEVRQAVLLSSDGLPTAASQGLAREDVEHLAAICAGFNSLAKDVGGHFAGGGLRQTMVMLEDAFLFVTPAGEGSCLAVLSDAGTDVGQLAYEMSLLVKRAGRHLGIPARVVPQPHDE